jgi:hypothetical protein
LDVAKGESYLAVQEADSAMKIPLDEPARLGRPDEFSLMETAIKARIPVEEAPDLSAEKSIAK